MVPGKIIEIIIFISILLCIAPLALRAGTLMDNFDDGDLMGWNINIAAGVTVINGELQFKGADPIIAKLGDAPWKGYSLKARVKIARFANSGWFSIRILQGASGDLSGYYELRLAKKGTIAALYVNNHCVESFRTLEEIKENVWHRVEIKLSDGKVSVYLDGVLIAKLTDMKLSGYMDMCSIKGTHTFVDDIVISGPNIPDTGPSGLNSFAVKPRLKLATTWGKIKQ